MNFSIKNKNDQIRINGHVAGRVNNLSGRNIDLKIGRKVSILGDFNSRNLADKNEAIVNMGFSKLNTHFSVLSQLISGFNPPTNFYKLGNINFKGRFDGYFQDFVAFGDLASDLGDANLDMRMDLKGGKALAAYSGKLDLQQFDLAGWTGNSDFGTIDLSSAVEDGIGLTLETVSADLGAKVHSFYYKGYHYEDFSMDGKLQKNLFDGKFKIEDPNIDLDFAGSVDFIDSIPAFSFDADVRALNLKALNLTSQNYQMSGLLNVDMKGADLDIISGTAIGKDISLSNGAFQQDLDSIYLKSDQLSLIKSIQFYSDLMQGNLLGDFDINSLPDAFIHVLKENYPKYSAGLNYISEDTIRNASTFDFDILVVDSENLFSLIMNNSFRIKSLLAKGTINDSKNLLVGSFEAPEITFKDYRFLNIKSKLFSEESNGTFNIRLDSIIQGENKIDPIQLISRTSGDSLIFDFHAKHLYDIGQNIYLSGILSHEGENFVLNLKDSHFEMLNETWDIKFHMPVLFRKNFIDIQDVSITDGSVELKLNDVQNRGLNCEFVQLPFSIINDFAPVEKLEFGGLADGMIEVDDVFNQKKLATLLLSKNFTVNGDSYGELRITAASNDLKKDFNYNGKLVLDDQSATLSGQYLFEQKITEGIVLVNKYPVSILEYFLGEGGISSTSGSVTGEIDYSGPISNLEVSGFANTKNVTTNVDYLGVTYKVKDGQFQIRKDLLDFTGMQLIDSEGNLASLDGGLTHQGFRNLALDLNIQAPRFVALNTTKENNPSFYGYGAGKINVDFSGPFKQIFIDVIATTGRSSVLSIPVESSEEEVDQSFIQFINKEDLGKEDAQEQSIDLSSLNLNMNLEITDQAEVIIIFDENANDILRSRGRGGIQLEINPQGEFIMFGNYQVESGQYLFTLPFVNKPFSLNNGGTIIWTGDPLNAQVAVEAEYQNLRAPLDIFLAEYLTEGTAVEAAAQRETEVQLTMKLSGTLLSPTINFDLAFPNVSGNLKSFTDSKLRTLKADESALYDQVFSLIVFQTFLPDANPLQIGSGINSLISETTYNTFSEFASSQISILLTSLLEEAIIDNKYWSDIDFQFGLSKNNGLFASENSLLPDEVNLHIINKFNNDKWSFNIGGDYKEDPIKNQAYLTGDFILEYFLTEDRRLKLRMYGKLDYDELNFQRKQKVGLGINYRREFNSLWDWRKSKEKANKI